MKKLSKIMESIWMDIHKHSTGDIDRKEENINNLTIDEFCELLKCNYTIDRAAGRTSKIEVGENSLTDKNDKSIHIPLYASVLNGKVYKNIPQCFRVHYNGNKITYLIFNSSKHLLENCDFSELEKVIGDDYVLSDPDDRNAAFIYPKGREFITHKEFLDVFDKILSVLKYPIIYKKTNESVWMDIHKRSAGDAERKEESIDLMDFDDFSDYLLDRYKCRNSRNNFGIGTWFLGGPDDWRQIEVPIEIPAKSDKEVASNLRLTYDYNHKECIDFTFPYGTFFAKYPEFRKYVLDNYQVIRKPDDDMRTGTGELILPKPGKKLMFHDYVELIDKALSCSKKPYLKLNESVWMDIHKQSTGDMDRKEDDINNFSPNEFWEYLREIYFDGDLGYDGIGHFDYGIYRSFSKNLFEITIPFGAVESVVKKTYKKIQRLYLKINDQTYKYESIEISDDVEGLEEILSENGYVFEKRLPPKSSMVYPKNGEITNKTIINLIDLLLKTTEFPMLKKK